MSLRDTVPFAVLFSAQFLGRAVFDWFVPTDDFHLRATVSTLLGVSTLLLAGAWAGWKSGRLAAGAAAGVMTAGIAAVISIAGVAVLYAIFHSPETIPAIRASGGIEEAFTLPIMMLLPGVLMGAIGGAISSTIKKLATASSAH